MFSRIGLVIQVGLRKPLFALAVGLREPAFVLIGASGGALAVQAGVSPYIAVPVALLLVCWVSVRR